MADANQTANSSNVEPEYEPTRPGIKTLIFILAVIGTIAGFRIFG